MNYNKSPNTYLMQLNRETREDYLETFKTFIKKDARVSKVQQFISTIYSFDQSTINKEWQVVVKKPLFSIASIQQTVKFVCAKRLQPSQGQKYLKAYYCFQCAEEKNSVVCEECFDKEKHKEHRVELIKIVGGCCDCGDSSMWKEKGFCNYHSKNKVKHSDIFKDRQQQLSQLCTCIFHALCYLYDALESFIEESFKKEECKQQSQQFIKDMTMRIDNFGKYFTNNLIAANRDRYNLSKITRKWLRSALVLPEQLKFVKEKTIYEQYMRFTKLENTAKECVELFIMLFNRAELFKQQVAVTYFYFYSSIPGYLRTGYSDFSAQLFISSTLHQQLIKKNKVQPAIATIQLNQKLEGALLQKQVKQFGEYYEKYYKDMKLLLSLGQKNSTHYWRSFQQKVGLTKIASYPQAVEALEGHNRTIFLKMINKLVYKIEENAMACILKVISKLIRSPDFIKNGITEQFKIYSIQSEKYDSIVKQQQYMFFTNQRILSVLLFAYFYKIEKLSSSAKIQQKHLTDLMDLVKLDKDQFKSYLQFLLKLTLRYFIKVSQAVSSDTSIINNHNFATTYFKSFSHPNLLYSIDAFLFRFLFHSLQQLQDPNNFEQFIVSAVNTQLQNLKTQFNAAVSDYHVSYQNRIRLRQQTNDHGYIMKNQFEAIEKVILCYRSFINLITQSVGSDLVEIVLLTHIEQFLNDNKFGHHQKIMQFYQRFLHTIKASHHDPQSSKRNCCLLVDFRDLVRYLFFKEATVFKKFVEQYKSSESKQYLWQQDKHKTGSMLNMEMLYSMRFKMQNSTVKEHFPKVQFLRIPLYQTSKYRCYFFSKTIYLAFTKQILKALMQVRESQSNLINDVVKELCRMQHLTMNKQIHQYFSTEFLHLRVKQNLNEYQKILSIYSFIDVRVETYLKSFRLNASHIKSCNKDEDNEASLHIIEQRMLEEINSEQSKKYAMQEKQPNNISLQPQSECVFSKTSHCEGHSDLQWLCYAKEGIMHQTFTIDISQQFLMLSTCGHLCHRKCLQGVGQDKPVNHCPKCRKTFNLILPAHLIPQGQVSREYFKRLNKTILAEIPSFMPNSARSVSDEIFRCIIIFIVQFLTVKDFSFLKDNILLYRSLLGILKTPQAISSLSLPQKRAIQLSGSSVSEANILISCVIELLNNTLPIKNKPYSRKPSKRTRDHQFLISILQFLDSHQLEWTKPDLPDLAAATVPLYRALEYLPQNLNQLSSKHNPAQCHNQTNQFFICLLPHPEDYQPECLCQVCLKENLGSHIRKCHLNETLLISSESGTVQYYFRGEKRTGEKMFLHEEPSVYRAWGTGQAFSSGKGLQKKECRLSEQRLKRILRQFISGKLTVKALAKDK